jgi:hypothetical protein
VRGYSKCKAANLTLQMQVNWAVQKIKGEVSLCPKAAAAYLLLTLETAATAARLTQRTITPNQVAVPMMALVLPPLRLCGHWQDSLGEDGG